MTPRRPGLVSVTLYMDARRRRRLAAWQRRAIRETGLPLSLSAATLRLLDEALDRAGIPEDPPED